MGCGQLGASIDHHDDRSGFVECDPSLAKNFRRNKVPVVWNDSSGIDHAEIVPQPMRLAVKAVARDSGLVADNRAARTNQPVEQRGLADVWPADNCDKRKV